MQLDEAISRVAQLRLRFFRTARRCDVAERKAGERLSKTLADLRADIQALTLVKNAAMTQVELRRKVREGLSEVAPVLGPQLQNWRVHYAYSNIGRIGVRRAFLYAEVTVCASFKEEAIEMIKALCKKERRVFRRVIQAKKAPPAKYPADIALAS